MATWIKGRRSISYGVEWKIKNREWKGKGLREEALLFHHGQNPQGKKKGGKPSVSECGCRQLSDLIFAKVRYSQLPLENWKSLLPQLNEGKGREGDRIN